MAATIRFMSVQYLTRLQNLLRGLSAMLSKVPLSMTLLDPERGPIFQNEQSLG